MKLSIVHNSVLHGQLVSYYKEHQQIINGPCDICLAGLYLDKLNLT